MSTSIHYDVVWFVLDFRKKVLDFYQRNSMSAYCVAFAYRPVSEVGKWCLYLLTFLYNFQAIMMLITPCRVKYFITLSPFPSLVYWSIV